MKLQIGKHCGFRGDKHKFHPQQVYQNIALFPSRTLSLSDISRMFGLTIPTFLFCFDDLVGIIMDVRQRRICQISSCHFFYVGSLYVNKKIQKNEI